MEITGSWVLELCRVWLHTDALEIPWDVFCHCWSVSSINQFSKKTSTKMFFFLKDLAFAGYDHLWYTPLKIPGTKHISLLGPGIWRFCFNQVAFHVRMHFTIIWKGLPCRGIMNPTACKDCVVVVLFVMICVFHRNNVPRRHWTGTPIRQLWFIEVWGLTNCYEATFWIFN